MPSILLLKGLPGSGKTTFAKDYLRTHRKFVRVNNDEVQLMLFNQAFNEDGGKTLEKVRKAIIAELVKNKVDFIVDNTNLSPRNEEQYRKLAEENGYDFYLKDFTDVPVAVCLERNAKRATPVPEKVIYKMYRDFIEKPPEALSVDSKLPSAIIVDIDGTIAKMANRSPYDHTRYFDDITIPATVELVHRYHPHTKLIFLTGRDDEGQEITEKWLEEKAGFSRKIHDYILIMRKVGDVTPDFEYKKKMYEDHIKGKYNVLFALEDRLRNVQMFRNQGLLVFHVDDGLF